MTLGEIAGVVGGDVAPEVAEVVVTGPAFVDSRAPEPGGLYVALVGERVDGHDFASGAFAGGAAGAIAARPTAAPTVVVADVVGALGRLASHVVDRLPDLTVIGLTGSQGKTSTKDLLQHVLSSVAPTVATVASQNHELGVPLTVLRAGPDTAYLVTEMGARGLGHIAFLAEMVRPRVGLVLNVGVAHLGEFGSQDGIAAAKGELVAALPAGGLAVLNADDPRVAAMAARTRARVVTFGSAEGADVRLTDVMLDHDGHPRFRLEWRGRSDDIVLSYVGAHHASNAAATAAVALGLDLPLGAVAAALRTAVPVSRWRMEVSTSPDGVLVVNDAYNANPDSVRAALSTVVDIAAGRPGARVVAVLGEMRELGDAAPEQHAEVGRYAADLGVDHLIVVGEAARPAYDAARRRPTWRGTAEAAPDASAALAIARGALRPGDVVLVKASRAASLEGLALVLATGESPAGTDGGR